MTISISELLEQNTTLVTFPEVAIRINTMVEDGNSSADDIGELIAQDPALTVRLLKIANSAYFGFSAKIETVARAVAVLGTQKVKDLTLGIAVSKAFADVLNDILSMEHYWRHSLLCGLTASELATRGSKASNGAAFTSGLLHDIGHLIMFNQEPELSRQAVMMIEAGNGIDEMHLAEKILFGFDHAQLGEALARNWNLPDRLVACIAHHHYPQQADNYVEDVCLIHIANAVAVLAEIHSTDFNDAPSIDPFAWETLGLSPESIPEILESVRADAEELLPILTAKAH